MPKSNTGYWGPKLQRNVERDAEAERKLVAAGWHVVVIWACEIDDPAKLIKELEPLLNAQTI